jgi:hypothetical protein
VGRLRSTSAARPARAARRSRALSRRTALVAAFLVGLALRLPGLIFNGMDDLDQMVLVWGADVAKQGIAEAFAENYGFLSYLAFGAAAAMAEWMPRFWWAPYKALEIAGEIGVVAALLALVPVALRLRALALYWLNPWFVLHGAWLGFWDGPWVAVALAGVVALGRIRDARLAWAAFGVLLATSAMLKPQGLFQVAGPVGLGLVVHALRGRGTAPLVAFAAGGAALLAAGAAFLVAAGSDALAIPRNYLGAAGAMPTLCNNCLNVWHPVTVALQSALGQSGPTWELVLPRAAATGLQLLAAVATLGAVVWFAWRLPLRATEPAARARSMLLLLAFASLVVASFGTMAHVNHGYAALVFAIPFAAERCGARAWAALVAIGFAAHFLVFGLGRAQVRPYVCQEYAQRADGCDTQWTAGVMTGSFADFANARVLIGRIHRSAARWRGLLPFQRAAGGIARRWIPDEPTLALLGGAQAIAALALLRALVRETRRE